jgi:hypothetical protein
MKSGMSDRRSACDFVREARRLLLSSLALLLLCVPAFAQLNLGSISGTLTDPSGAIIAGAKVTVTDIDRGVSRTLTSDSAGQYSAASLTPGSYSVRAEFMGFQTINRTGIAVGVGQAVRVDLAMQPGAQTQTVTVTEAVPLVNTTNEVLSSTVESPQLSQLPINGHLYTKVLDYQPGVHGNPGGNSPNYQTNGAGGQGNYFLLDGVENTNIFVNSGPLIGAATSTDELTILPQDAVQEVNVMTNPPAEYGWFQGAVVNVGLKSGTNALHGDAYGFGRNNNFDSYDPYLRGALLVPKQTDNFEQFGGSLGGPIKKDKLFYFGAFDGMRYTVGSGAFANVPTTQSIAGDLDSVPYAITNMVNTLGVAPSQLSLNLANCTVTGVAPAATASCGTKGIFFNNSSTTVALPVPGNNIGHSNNVIGRIDYHPTDRNAINGEYFFGQAVTQTPNIGEAPFWSNTNVSRTQMMRGVWIYTPSSNWVNDARFGYNRYNLADGNTECIGKAGQPDYAALGFISGANPPSPFCGFPTVNFNGAAGYAPFGANPSPPGLNDQGVFQFTYTIDDDVSYTHGKHNLKFGFEFHHSHFQGVGAPGGLTGVLNYFDGTTPGQLNTAPCAACTDLQNFLAGNVGLGQILANPQQENSSLGFNRTAFYVADDFRLNSRVTVNLGLRYELEPAILVDNNNAGNFDPASPSGMVQQNGSALYQADYKTLAPRAGFAWDITGKGTTVLRAGMGISYDTPQVDDLIAAGFGAGLNSVPTGFSLYNNTGLAIAAPTNPQAVKSAQLTIPGAGLGWATGVPVFNVSAGDLGCGTGNPAIALPDGAVPSPCTLKAKGTAVRNSNGTFSFNTNAARSPMYTWTLGIQHAFGSSTSLTVNYVGTHTYDLASEININQPAPGASANAGLAGALQGGYGTGPLTGPPQLRQPYYGQFPWFDGIFIYGPAGFSNYHALQVSFVQRDFHGLTFNASYTFSRDLATPKGGNNPYITNSQCVSCDYGLQTPTQDLGITVVYALPGIKSPLQMLQGWQVSSAINVQSGVPFSGLDGSNDLAGVGDGRGFFGGASEPWSIYGKGTNFSNLGKFTRVPCFGFGGGFGCNPTVPAACISAANLEPVNAGMNAEIPGSSSGLSSLMALGCYMSPNGKSVIIPPAQGTFGNMRPGTLISAPFHEWDLSLSKMWRIHERVGLQASVAAFNVLNSTNYALGFTGDIVNVPALFGQSSQDPNNGNPVNGTGGPREVMLGLKATF